MVPLSRRIRLTASFVTPGGLCSTPSQALQHQQRIGLHATKRSWFGLIPFRSPLLREYSLFLRVLRCFSSPRSPRPPILFSGRCLGIAQAGFPIRAPPDITPAHGSPGLIAVYHALLRPLAPRHSPYALTNLTRDAEKLKFVANIQLLTYRIYRSQPVDRWPQPPRGDSRQ
jgi:hypothetical protein